MANTDDPASLGRLHAIIDHFGDAHFAEVLERLGTSEGELRDREQRFAAEQSQPRKTRDRAASLAYAKEHTIAARWLSEERPKLESLGPRRVSSVPPADGSAPRSTRSMAATKPPMEQVALPDAPARVDAAPIASGDLKAPDPKSLPSYLRAPAQLGLTSSPLLTEPRVDAHLPSPPETTLEISRSQLNLEPLPFREPRPDDVVRVRANMESAPAPPVETTGTEELPRLGFYADPDSPEVCVASRVHLTLEQYAMILAQIGIDPAAEQRVWARFGIFDESDRREAERLFRAAFDERPKARTHLGEVVRVHRRRLLGR